MDKKFEEVSSSESSDEDENPLFAEEFERSGPYDFDFSIEHPETFHPVNFQDSEFTEEPETDGDFVDRMSKIAIKKYNDDKGTSLEFVRAVRANWNLGAGITFHITFEANDASDDIERRLFQARVVYFLEEFIVRLVNPKP